MNDGFTLTDRRRQSGVGSVALWMLTLDVADGKVLDLGKHSRVIDIETRPQNNRRRNWHTKGHLTNTGSESTLAPFGYLNIGGSLPDRLWALR